MSSHEILFEDDFSAYPLGPVPNTYSPWGEYHCRTDQGRLGPWVEATTHYAWRDSHGCWRVAEADGRRVLEQTFWTDRSYPLIVTGTAAWRDYRVEVDVYLLSHAAPAGLVVGYRHSRDFLVLLLASDTMSLVHRRHGQDTLLGAWNGGLGNDLWHRLAVDCGAKQLRVTLDGHLAGEIEWDFGGGGIGLLANAPARFASLCVTASAAEIRGIGERSARACHAQREHRRAYPQPVLWKRIGTQGFGTDRNLRIGDINGDGRNEIVMAQSVAYLGNDDYCGISALTALDLDGNVLWQRGTPVDNRHETTADLCFQIHDLDGKGRGDVLFTSDLRLHLADGATGDIKASIPTPATTPSKAEPGAYPLSRIIGDCLHFADLQGSGRKDTIVMKDRYSHAWVYDKSLNPLWDHACVTGHYPASADMDGDGRDELMLGYTLLSGDGTVLWTLDTFDHADGIVMGAFGPAGTPPRIALTGSDAGFFLLTAQGRVLCHREIGHAQTVAALKLRHDIPGLQLMVNTYWGEAGITLIMDWNGAVLHECEPMHYASLLTPVNWTDDTTELVLLSAHPSEGGMIDGHGNRVVVFPDDGHPTLCCDAKDIDGDGVDEILVWDYDALWIYKPERFPEGAAGPRRQRNAFFNESNYSGQVSFPPHC